MIENVPLPLEVINALNGESKDFVVQTTRIKPGKISYRLIIIALGAILVDFFIVFFCLWPILYGKQISSLVIIPVKNVANIQATIPPFLLIILVFLGTIGFLIFNLYNFYASNGVFIGTKTRLIQYKSNQIKLFSWKEFTGNVDYEIFKEKQDLTLEMKRRIMSEEVGYVADKVYICGISNASEIQKICQQRITENNQQK